MCSLRGLSAIIVIVALFLPLSMSCGSVHLSEKMMVSDESGPIISAFNIGEGSSFTRDYDDTIFILVIDEDGVDQVWCYNGINGSDDWTNVSMVHSHGDTYSCSISGYLNATITVWSFHFYANDTTGASSTYYYSCEIYYNAPDLPESPWVYLTPIILWSSVIIVAAVAVVWWYKKHTQVETQIITDHTT
jgi:hypothetical protein